MKSYDAIVIGAGQGGGPLAVDLANSGLETALIERAFLGGTCVNVGCTPTKTMVASARVAHVVARAPEYGVHPAGVRVDLERVRERKRNIVSDFRSGSEKQVERTKNLTWLHGSAAFVGAHEISVTLDDVGDETITGKRIFINTGTRNRTPNIPGLEAAGAIDSTSIMELGTLPEHLVVLGGGYIGLEFGQMFRRFGSLVTILHRGDQILSREDPDVSAELHAILRDEGIDILLQAHVARVRRDEGDQISVEFSTDSKDIACSHLLIATGRTPNVEDLSLDRAGIGLTDRGFIKVNDRLETDVDQIWAFGDVKGGPAFTHIAYDDYRILRTNLIEGGKATTQNRAIPYTVFTDPQLGRVGLSEREAERQGRRFKVARLPMTHVARALEMDETRGFMKVLVDSETDQILGCAILGIEGGEIATMIQIAMMGKLPYTALKDATFSHPTLGESLNNLFMAMDR